MASTSREEEGLVARAKKARPSDRARVAAYIDEHPELMEDTKDVLHKVAEGLVS